MILRSGRILNNMAEGEGHYNRVARKQLKVPDYDGESDVRTFIDLFEEVAQLNQWDDREKLLHMKLSLKGSARAAVNAGDYDNIRRSLIQRFETPMNTARKELRTLRRRPNESIHKFSDYIKRMVDLSYPTVNVEQRELMAMDELIDRSGDRLLQREFRLQPAETYTEVVNRINEYETEMRSHGDGRHVRAISTDNEIDTDVLTELQKSLKSIQISMEKMSAEQSRPYRSYNGQQHGGNGYRQDSHRYGNGNHNQRENSAKYGDNKTCHHCKQTGHFIRDCPAKKSARQSENYQGPDRQ